MARGIALFLFALLLHAGSFAKDTRHLARTGRHTTTVTADAEVLRVKNTNAKPAPAPKKNVQRTTARKASA